MKITEKVEAFARPVVEENGCELWDVEYVKEGGERFLRVLIDKPEGVAINDCAAISAALDPILDREDPIPESYTFEVCSAGAERPLKRPGDFERFFGSLVLVRLYKPKDGKKEFSGTLRSYENGTVGIEAEGRLLYFTKEETSLVRLQIEF